MSNSNSLRINRSSFFLLIPCCFSILFLGIFFALFSSTKVVLANNSPNIENSESQSSKALIDPLEQISIEESTNVIIIPTFTIGQYFEGFPKATVAHGDLDADGDLDLFFGRYQTVGGNEVWFNNGSGIFINSEQYLGSGITQALALGDLDGDGDLDVFISKVSTQPNEVWFNDGSGFYTNSGQLLGNGDTQTVALGDLNGDGYLDAFVGNASGQPNEVWFNNGSGTYTNSGQILGTGDTQSVALGDLDGDGDLDAFVGNAGLQLNEVWLNDGDGTFVNSGQNLGTGNTQAVALGDLDGDGDLDVFTADRLIFSNYAILINDGNGVFIPQQSIYLNVSIYDVTLGDFDNDGDFDVLLGIGFPVVQGGSAGNRVLLNDSSGNFIDTDQRLGSNDTRSLTVADFNGDGFLDFVELNPDDELTRLWLNNGIGILFAGPVLGVYSIAAGLGDLDGDGDLDALIAGAYWQNQGGNQEGIPGSFIPNYPGIGGTSIAIGDLDEDGDLDVVAGADGPNKVWFNDGFGNFIDSGQNLGNYQTNGIKLGDLDGDRDLDLVEVNENYFGKIWINNGNAQGGTSGVFVENRTFGAPPPTKTIALGDLDGDGDLDAIAGGEFPFCKNQVLLNNNVGYFSSTGCFGSLDTQDIALGDLDGDGDLDAFLGQIGPNEVWLNDGRGRFTNSLQFLGDSATYSVELGDFDNDGDLDVYSGNSDNYSQGFADELWLNSGGAQGGSPGEFELYQELPEIFGGAYQTHDVKIGDLNLDGVMDVITARIGDELGFINRVYFGNLGKLDRSWVHISHPGLTPPAVNYSTPDVLNEATIPITYTLFNSQETEIGYLKAYYSLEGGDNWQPMIATSNTITTNLTTGLYPTNTLYNTHVFTWDVAASGIWGEYDNVVFRMEIYPQPISTAITNTYLYTNQISGHFYWPYAAGSTLPFRVRGSQIRVYSGTITDTNVISNAIVYRLPEGNINGALPFSDLSQGIFRTDINGFLQGHGQTLIGDRLMALSPITDTENYTLYHTSATPTIFGLDMFTVTEFGSQNLVISSENSLILYNLDISLEWDARNEPIFLDQLAFDIKRTSELLFDWSNGQAALGNVTIYHAREHWNDADIRIYASNRLHPNAIIGGVVSEVLTETIGITNVITYAPGEVRMAVTWNRYGDPGGDLGEDWPRALAHELGHYLFFQDDDYLGLDANGLLVSVNTCPGVMSDPYIDDDASGFDEFHPEQTWLTGCQNTLANLNTGRADWTTIQHFYPWLSKTDNFGPNSLPLAVTQIFKVDPITPTTTLNTSLFNLIEEGGIYQASGQARAFLFQGDRLTDLGRPVLDQVNARGASPGDRLCVFDLAVERLGCETISALDAQLSMNTLPEWQPEVRLQSVTSNTLYITVTVPGLPVTSIVQARLYPSDYSAVDVITLTQLTPGLDIYTGSYVNLPNPAIEGYVDIWVNEPAPRREVITDFSLGGDPGPKVRGAGGMAPVISPDGQVILYGQNLDFPKGEFYAFQAATVLPQEISWATVIGQAYYLLTSDGAPDFVDTSIRFSYLGNEVPPGEETFLRIYFWDGASWIPLETQVDTYQNSAVAQVQGPGLYALMSSIEIPLYGPGWNLIGYPVLDSRPITETLLSIEGYYSRVCRYDATDPNDPWRCFDANAPGWANDLDVMEFGWGYWIYISDTVTLTLRLHGAAQLGMSADDLLNQNSTSPPATYFGYVLPDDNFIPQPGMDVVAWMDETYCGQATTFAQDGQIAFVIDVSAFGTGNSSGCGLPGQTIKFQVDGQNMSPIVLWDDSRAWKIILAEGYRYFLPIIEGY